VPDLATAHRTWWHSQVDRTITPSAHLLRAGRRAGAANVHGHPLGIPVREQFGSGNPPSEGKATLRVMLGIRPGRFVVLVTAGADGGRGLEVWVRTIVRRLADVDVVAVCGRNESLRAELGELTASTGGRLLVTGFVDTISDWVRCADLVVSKAGPSIIAEAASVGVPLLLPAHIPGQEAGNADMAVAAGAARRVRGRRDLIRQIDALRQDAATLAGMRAAATRFSRPHAAIRIAELVADEAWTNADPSSITPLRKKTQ
jgi:UDP-N-acetylglucosamine:LPS N-acetylglucosamine transferase